jgi:hypothetical protein
MPITARWDGGLRNRRWRWNRGRRTKRAARRTKRAALGFRDALKHRPRMSIGRGRVIKLTISDVALQLIDQIVNIIHLKIPPQCHHFIG